MSHYLRVFQTQLDPADVETAHRLFDEDVRPCSSAPPLLSIELIVSIDHNAGGWSRAVPSPWASPTTSTPPSAHSHAEAGVRLRQVLRQETGHESTGRGVTTSGQRPRPVKAFARRVRLKAALSPADRPARPAVPNGWSGPAPLPVAWVCDDPAARLGRARRARCCGDPARSERGGAFRIEALADAGFDRAVVPRRPAARRAVRLGSDFDGVTLVPAGATTAPTSLCPGAVRLPVRLRRRVVPPALGRGPATRCRYASCATRSRWDSTSPRPRPPRSAPHLPLRTAPHRHPCCRRRAMPLDAPSLPRPPGARAGTVSSPPRRTPSSSAGHAGPVVGRRVRVVPPRLHRRLEGHVDPDADTAALVAVRQIEQRRRGRRPRLTRQVVFSSGSTASSMADWPPVRVGPRHPRAAARRGAATTPGIATGCTPTTASRWLAFDGVVAARDPHFFPSTASPPPPLALLLFEPTSPTTRDVSGFAAARSPPSRPTSHSSRHDVHQRRRPGPEREQFRRRILDELTRPAPSRPRPRERYKLIADL